MKVFLKTLKPSLILLLYFTLLLGIGYPALVWGLSQIFFRTKANGSLVYDRDGKIIGSELIAQNFTRPEYFHPRPSAAGEKGYDAANSSGSNLGPTSQKLIDALTPRAQTYRLENGLSSEQTLPVDAITASGSGLDPHISVENAMIQAARVAGARSLSSDEVIKLVNEYTEEPFLKIFGERCVNVLRINFALDKLNSEMGRM